MGQVVESRGNLVNMELHIGRYTDDLAHTQIQSTKQIQIVCRYFPYQNGHDLGRQSHIFKPRP